MSDIDKYVESLKGISYCDWIKLKIGIDGMFEYQKGESEKKLKFADSDKVKKIIRSQFG